MGTIAFLILRFIFKFNTPGFDFALFCLLVSIDSLSIVQLIRPKKS